MTALLGQQDLERWLGETNSALKKPRSGQLGVAGSLHESALRLLVYLARDIRGRHDIPSSLLHSYLNEIERFFLWGDGFSAEEEGSLDSILDRSSEIRMNVLSLLYDTGEASKCRQPQKKHPLASTSCC